MGGSIGGLVLEQLLQVFLQKFLTRSPETIIFSHRLATFFPTHLQFCFLAFLLRFLIEKLPLLLLHDGLAEANPKTKTIASKRARSGSLMIESVCAGKSIVINLFVFKFVLRGNELSFWGCRYYEYCGVCAVNVFQMIYVWIFVCFLRILIL